MEDEDADDSATALREAKEEIGLDPTLVHVLANLEPFMSEVGFCLMPFASYFMFKIVIYMFLGKN